MERTLPSVHEMLRSTPMSNTIPAYHHTALPGNAAVTLKSSAKPSASPDQSYRASDSHTSHASPTESAISTSSSERQHYQHLTAQPTKLPIASFLAKDFYPDGLVPQTPFNAQRHESAIAPQPFDHSPDSRYRPPPQVTNDNYQPTGRRYLATRSPVPTTSLLLNPTSSVQQGHVFQRFAPAPTLTATSSSQRILIPPLPSDSQSTSKRYNVRFAANHTPLTMPSAQRSRPNPPSAAVQPSREAPTLTTPPQPDNSPREIVPAIQVMLRHCRSDKKTQELEESERDSSVDRCPHCDEAWNRPLPDLAKWDQDSPAENANGLARANMYIFTKLQQHGKDADLKYEQWKEKHSHCARNGYRDKGTSPVLMEPTLSTNGGAQEVVAAADEAKALKSPAKPSASLDQSYRASESHASHARISESVVSGIPRIAGSLSLESHPVHHTEDPIEPVYLDSSRELSFSSKPVVAPSDSGYHSGRAGSVCSMDSTGSSLGIPQDFLQDFIAFFADALMEKAGATYWRRYAQDHHSAESTKNVVETALKKFTVNFPLTLTQTSASSPHILATPQQSGILIRATSLIRHCRPKITSYIICNGITQSTSNDSMTERLRSRGLGQHLSVMEKIGHLEKSGSVESRSHERDAGQEDGEDKDVDGDADLLAALCSIQDLLVSSDAFTRLAADLRQGLYRDPALATQLIATCVAEAWKHMKPGTLCEGSFAVSWKIHDFMLEQYGRLVPIETIVVLTGSAVYAQATTCGDYVRTTWPEVGEMVLWMLNQALEQSGEAVIQHSLRNQKRSSIRIVTEPGHGYISVSAANEAMLLEIAQLLAWLSAALSSSPFAKKLAYATPSITPTGVHGSDSKNVSFGIDVHYTKIPATEKACWLSLFERASIATGFPIPERGTEIGLEIPLQLLAGIAGVCHATEHGGGIVMKGFCHMLVPVRKTGKNVQWHAITAPDSDTYLSYTDGLSRCESRALLQEFGFDDLQSTRVFLGWCSVATSRLGSDAADYERIEYSGAEDAGFEMHCSKAQIGFQQIATAGLDVTYGRNQGTCHVQCSSRYSEIISVADNTRVLLYDTGAARAWLVNASDVILHMIQHRHHRNPYEKDGRQVHLDTNIGPMSSPKKVLMKHEKVHMSDDGDYLFSDVVRNLWSMIESLVGKTATRYQNGEGLLIEGGFRTFLPGYEFYSIVEERMIYRLNKMELPQTHGGWPMLVHDIDALVLLADGLGDIISPANQSTSKLCTAYQRMPSGLGYLATTGGILKDLFKVAGRVKHQEYLTRTRLQWHRQSSHLFDACENPSACRCDRLQRIYPKNTFGRIVPPGLIEDNVAVIFGESKGKIHTKVHNFFSKSRVEPEQAPDFYHHPNTNLIPLHAPSSPEDSLSDTCGEIASLEATTSTSTSTTTCTIRSINSTSASTPEMQTKDRPVASSKKRVCDHDVQLGHMEEYTSHQEGHGSSRELRRKRRFGLQDGFDRGEVMAK